MAEAEVAFAAAVEGLSALTLVRVAEYIEAHGVERFEARLLRLVDDAAGREKRAAYMRGYRERRGRGGGLRDGRAEAKDG
jgi:hypothetical protein